MRQLKRTVASAAAPPHRLPGSATRTLAGVTPSGAGDVPVEGVVALALRRQATRYV